MKKEKKGLIVVFTGDGKGKTTAALGVALRASGHGMNTLMIEFMKEEGKSGEQKVCPAMLQKIDIYPFGMGFVFRGDDPRPHMEIVENAWLFMEEMLSKKKYQILILDELSVALSLGLFPVDSVIRFLKLKDNALHVIITGRDAPSELIKIADIVTEMKEVKHIFKEGTAATLGLDY
ncbi:MAG: cob(I)yrinic acid a,c-diamide adenosyltransferase [Proteobacteria bacterium]|nr:cob(I)yrinic acid a,c-diamide adenosyltransferase [Pseudomonadota bacterium]